MSDNIVSGNKFAFGDPLSASVGVNFNLTVTMPDAYALTGKWATLTVSKFEDGPELFKLSEAGGGLTFNGQNIPIVINNDATNETVGGDTWHTQNKRRINLTKKTMNLPIIPAEKIIPAETVEKPALDGVFVSHLRYQDQSEDGSKACTVTCHYMNADGGEKDYAKKAYTLKTGDLDSLMTDVPSVAKAFLDLTNALTEALPDWIAHNAEQAETPED